MSRRGLTSVVFAGRAGGPALEAARSLGEAARRAGLDASVSPDAVLDPGGGSLTVHVRYGPEVLSPLVPDEGARVLVAFDAAEALRAARWLAPEGLAVVRAGAAGPGALEAGPDREREADALERLETLARRLVLVRPAEAGPAGDDGALLLGTAAHELELPLEALLAALGGEGDGGDPHGGSARPERRRAFARGLALFGAPVGPAPAPAGALRPE